jgi:hypothetical protein
MGFKARLVMILAIVATALTVVAFFVGFAGPRSIHFFAEEVTLRASAAPELEVDGIYHLRNDGVLPLRLPIRFPFSPGPEIVSTQVELVEQDGESRPFRATESQASFTLRFAAHQESTLRVRYRQKLTTFNGHYVVMTVRDWGAAVDHAQFAIELPEGCSLVSASSPLDPHTGRADVRAFWPEHDLEFSWSCPK